MMIRAAFLGVALVAGLIAYMAFALVRGQGGERPAEAAITALQPADNAANPATGLAPDMPPATPAEPAAGLYFLRNLDLGTGSLALILYGAGSDATAQGSRAGEKTDLVVTDPSALRAAQTAAHFAVLPDHPALALSQTAAHDAQVVAALYRDDTLVTQVVCTASSTGSTTGSSCAEAFERFTDAGLLAAADPLVRIDDQFDSYDAYLDTLAAIANDANFAVLDLRPEGGGTHPVAQSVPTASMALPTIVRTSDLPLNRDTHGALLLAILRDTIPEGITVDAITIQELGSPIVVDADNGRPATAGGVPISFPALQYYTPYVALSGAADVPDDTLDALTGQTLLRADFDDAAARFIASLGLPCADCFRIAPVGDTFDAATVIHRQPELYPLAYYDLREAP